jgi:hypothetical protein
MLTKTRLWKTPSACNAMSTIFGEVHLEDGWKSFIPPLRDVADVELFHRRHTDDGGGVNGILSMRDGGDVEDGIRLGTVATTPAHCGLFLNQQHAMAVRIAD